MCQLSIETSCNIAPTHPNVLPIRNGSEEGLQRERTSRPQFKNTDTRGPAVSGRSRLPFPRERRPGALSLFLNPINYQLIYAPGFTVPQCPRGVPVRNQLWNVLSLRCFASALVLPSIVLVGLVEPSQSQGW